MADLSVSVLEGTGTGAVRITGYKELLQAFRLLAPELAKELNAALRVIVQEVQAAAVSEASAKGFAPPGTSGRGTGRLIGSIRSGVTMTKGYVSDPATNEGYSYPRRYEYEASGARAFLHPAIEKNRDKIYADLVAAVERANARFNEGGTL